MRIGGALAAASFLLVAGSMTIGIVEAASTCAETSVHASQIRTREDIWTFARCAQELVRDKGTNEAYRAFHEDDRWSSGQFYVYVNALSRRGSGLRTIVFPPDPGREGNVWVPAPDRLGPGFGDDPNLVVEGYGGGWLYYDNRNPATGRIEFKATYALPIDWDGTDAFLGVGISEPDIPSACLPEVVNAAALAREPSEGSLRAFVRCAAWEMAAKGYFAMGSLAETARWRAGSIYLFGIDASGKQLFTGNPLVSRGGPVLEWGAEPKMVLGGRDIVGVTKTFGETPLYYEALNPLSGAVQRKVSIVKSVSIQGKPVLLGSGYYRDCQDGSCSPVIGASPAAAADQTNQIAIAQACVSAREAVADRAPQRVAYGFYTDYRPVSYAATQDSSDPAFHQALGYEPDLIAGVEALANGKLTFDRVGIGNPFSGIWYKAAEDGFDIVGGGITALEQRTFDADGTRVIRFGSSHLSFRQSLLVRTASAINGYGDLTGEHRVGVFRGTTGEETLLRLTGIENADGQLLSGTRVELTDGSVIVAGEPGSAEALRITASGASGPVSARARLLPASEDLPDVRYYDSDGEQIDALAEGEIDAVAGDEIGHRSAASAVAGLRVTEPADIAAEQSGFSYAATPEGDRLRNAMDAFIGCLTANRSIGFQQWSEGDGNVFLERALTLR